MQTSENVWQTDQSKVPTFPWNVGYNSETVTRKLFKFMLCELQKKKAFMIYQGGGFCGASLMGLENTCTNIDQYRNV